jgi:hypothetical protein
MERVSNFISVRSEDSELLLHGSYSRKGRLVIYSSRCSWVSWIHPDCRQGGFDYEPTSGRE